MFDLNIMQDDSEVIHYDQAGVPIYIQTRRLSAYPDMRALLHWHEDLELIYILRGEMCYDVNRKKRLLKEGDFLFVNSRQMHYGYSNLHRECEFICILFHPKLVSSSDLLAKKYVTPIIESGAIESLCYPPGTRENAAAARIMRQLMMLREHAGPSYEMEVLSCLHHFWSFLFQQCEPLLTSGTAAPADSDVLLQKKMVSYIYQHYQDALTLDEIAASGNMSRSKCCALFRRYLQQSPIDFLNAYRLKVSCNLLSNTRESISQIALSCGFNHPSYFSKLFARYFKMTPGEYRKSSENGN